MGRPKGSKNKNTAAGSSEKNKYAVDRPMTVADKEEILKLGETKTIKEISGIVNFDMDWVSHVIDALMPNIDRKAELTKHFFNGV